MRFLQIICLIVLLNVPLFAQRIGVFSGVETRMDTYTFDQHKDIGNSAGILIPLKLRHANMFIKLKVSHFGNNPDALDITGWVDIMTPDISAYNAIKQKDTFRLNYSGQFLIGPQVNLTKKMTLWPLLGAGFTKKGAYEQIGKENYFGSMNCLFGDASLMVARDFNMFDVAIMSSFNLDFNSGNHKRASLELIIML